MKAVVQDRYGSEEVLTLREIAPPGIAGGQVLVRVHAASLHIGDWHLMTGMPYLVRAVGFGLRVPKVRVRGMDIAGTVEAVGRDVTRFCAGDEVFGVCDGGFAEYAGAREDHLAHKPAKITFAQAAAVPTSALAALQALRDKGGVRAGQRVLIVGASGGVGIFAVQIAKSFGAKITGVCSTGKVEMVRALGADRVIDYTRDDFTLTTQRYDVILDLGGNRPLADLRRLLVPNGILVLVGAEGGGRWLGGIDRWIQALAWSPFVSHKLRPLSSEPCAKDLLWLRKLIDRGQLTPMVDSTYTLAEVRKALGHMMSGSAQGKIVLTI